MKLLLKDVFTFTKSYRLWNDVIMERSQIGSILILEGVILFFASLFILIPQPGLYLISLFIMFFSVASIAIGFAYTRSSVKSNDTSE